MATKTIIYKLNDNNYDSIVKNYLDNLFESHTHIYHPDYLYQIVYNDYIEKNNIKLQLIDTINEYYIKKKEIIRDLIKKNKFSLNSLNQIIINYIVTVKYLEKLLFIFEDTDKIFIKKLFSDQILISFLEVNIIKEENINDIKAICVNISKYSEEYKWFLKLIGSIYNISDFKIESDLIPEKYKIFYEIIYYINRVDHITKIFNFINEINYIVHPLLNKIEQIIITGIELCTNLTELINLIIGISKINTCLFLLNSLLIKNKLAVSINRLLLDLNNFSNNEIYNFLNLMIVSKQNNIIMNDILLIFQNNNINRLILDIIDNSINDQPDFIKNFIPFLINITEINLFFTVYYELLIKRILSEQTNIYNEKTIIDIFNIYFDKKILFKINKVINDVIISHTNLNYYKTKYNINNFNTMTTSYSNWNINYNEGFVKFKNNINSNSELYTRIIHYQTYYNTIYDDKNTLIWLLHFGEVKIKYNNIIIILLPIQLLVLELFNNNNFLSIDDIKSQYFFENYSDKFKNNIILSLINAQILTNIKNIYTLNLISVDTNLIEIYINITKITELEKPITSKLNNLAYSPQDITRCFINKYVKVKSYDKNELYNLIKDNKYFELTDEIFNKALDIMIKLDYVIVNDNIVSYVL